MSKERELLERSLYFLEPSDWEEDSDTSRICIKLACEVEELLAQPEHNNTQYLLDQVSRLTAENAMLKEKWSTPQLKPLSDEEIEKFWEDNFYNGINFYARAIEKAHGIGGDNE